MTTVRCQMCGIEGDPQDAMLYCEVCGFWLCEGVCCNPHVDQDAERHEDHRIINSPN